MIILITGASCTGKTYLSQRILERYFYPYYSIDHIKMGLYRGDKNCTFHPEDDDIKISTHLAPIIDGIIRTAIENEQNLTIEGCYFESSHIKKIICEYPSQVMGISLIMTDDYCRKNFSSKVIENRSIIEKRGLPENRSIQDFIHENNRLRLFSEITGFKILEIHKEYEKMIKNLFLYLDTKLVK